MNNATAILLITCKDHKGLVARVSAFIHDFGGNIIEFFGFGYRQQLSIVGSND